MLILNLDSSVAPGRGQRDGRGAAHIGSSAPCVHVPSDVGFGCGQWMPFFPNSSGDGVKFGRCMRAVMSCSAAAAALLLLFVLCCVAGVDPMPGKCWPVYCIACRHNLPVPLAAVSIKGPRQPNWLDSSSIDQFCIYETGQPHQCTVIDVSHSKTKIAPCTASQHADIMPACK